MSRQIGIYLAGLSRQIGNYLAGLSRQIAFPIRLNIRLDEHSNEHLYELL